jgi:hypothetical protein
MGLGISKMICTNELNRVGTYLETENSRGKNQEVCCQQILPLAYGGQDECGVVGCERYLDRSAV